MKVDRKIQRAEEVIDRCAGPNGFLASLEKYREYWLRDFVYSQPLLLEAGYREECAEHLGNFLSRVDSRGRVPARIKPLPDYTISLAKRAYKHARLTLSDEEVHPIDRSYLSHVNKQPWTSDNELLAVIGSYQHSKITGDHGIVEKYGDVLNRLVNSIENRTENLLISGNDWRDLARPYYSKFLFSNQVLLYKALSLAGKESLAERTRKKISDLFWNEKLGYFEDFIGSTHFDVFAHSLGILYGVIPRERIPEVIEALQTALTEFGCKNLDEAYQNLEPQNKNWYQNGTFWPFIQGYAILALLRVGEGDLAKEIFRKFVDLEGFNEWYDPETGRPEGSRGQLWSAALFLQAYLSLINKGLLKKNGNQQTILSWSSM